VNHLPRIPGANLTDARPFTKRADNGLGGILRRAGVELMKFLAWEVLNPSILWLKRTSRYHLGSQHIGLNLGCGLDNSPGWLGIDMGVYLLCRKLPRFFIRSVFTHFHSSRDYSFEEFSRRLRSPDLLHFDLTYGIPLGDACVDYVYSSHLLEHLEETDARALLRECSRVLRPGGVVRICVPSLSRRVEIMKAAIEAYERGDSERIQAFVATSRIGFVSTSRNRHMYDFAGLRALLLEVGFRNVEERQFQQGRLPCLDTLERRPSLQVEAIRP
jgi:predicted SAM-dependent methyltransferase